LLNSIFMVAGSFIFFPYFRFMPMAVIAAILVFVAVRMVEREHFIRLLYHDKPHFLIALIVASLTVYFDPIIGIVLGAALALLFLVNTLAKSYYELIVHESKTAHRENLIDAEKRNLLIYAFKGKLVYLNSKAHLMRFQSDFSSYAGIILVLHDVYFIDLDGVDTLDEIIELIQNREQLIIIVQPLSHVRSMLHSSTAFKELEKEGLVFDSLQGALEDFDRKSSS
jgi:sulfate permease, SulP family